MEKIRVRDLDIAQIVITQLKCNLLACTYSGFMLVLMTEMTGLAVNYSA